MAVGSHYTVKMNMLYLIKTVVATDYKQYYSFKLSNQINSLQVKTLT